MKEQESLNASVVKYCYLRGRAIYTEPHRKMINTIICKFLSVFHYLLLAVFLERAGGFSKQHISDFLSVSLLGNIYFLNAENRGERQQIKNTILEIAIGDDLQEGGQRCYKL